MPWSDDDFRQRVTARAAEMGVPLSRLLDDAGVSPDLFYKTPALGRRIDTIEKIAVACRWSLAEAMDFAQRTDPVLLGRAMTHTETVLRALPKYARIDAVRWQLLASFYDELAAHPDASAEHLRACENMMIRFAAGSKEPAREP